MEIKKLDLQKYEKVIILAPHPDDEVLGCHSVLFNKNIRDKITILYLTDGCFYDYPKVRSAKARDIRKKELELLCAHYNFDYKYFGFKDTHLSENVINAKEVIKKYLKDNNLLDKSIAWFVPHSNESHEDHKAAYKVYRALCYDTACAAKFYYWDSYYYEIWTPIQKFNQYEQIYTLYKKQMLNFYQSQMQDVPYIEGIFGLNRYRGLQMLANEHREVFIKGGQL